MWDHEREDAHNAAAAAHAWVERLSDPQALPHQPDAGCPVCDRARSDHDLRADDDPTAETEY